MAYVAIGTNLGDRMATIRSAIESLANGGMIVAASSIYETEPVGYLEQPAFLNAVVKLDTWLAAEELLEVLQIIEREHGRTREFANGPRTLDLDLLMFDAEKRDRPDLTLPHPRMHERAFVLVPLAEIDPDVEHPVLKRSAKDLLWGIDQSGVRRYASPPEG